MKTARPRMPSPLTAGMTAIRYAYKNNNDYN